MRKKNFLIFIAIVLALSVGIIGFIQSSRFAKIVKTIAANRIPKNIGVVGDFSDFQIKIFPPGISIREPEVQLEKENIFNLPGGSVVEAKEVVLKFYPLQMLTGNIRVHEIEVLDGNVELKLDPSALKKAQLKKSKKKKFTLKWEHILDVQVESFSFIDTQVRVVLVDPKLQTDFSARWFKVSQVERKGKLGYQFDIDIEEVEGTYPKRLKIPKKIDRVRSRVVINEDGAQIDEVSVWMEGLTASLIGQADGNVLEPEKLNLNSYFNIRGNLAQIFELANLRQYERDIEGQVSFTGQIQTDLMRLQKTLVAEGTLSGQSLRAYDWKADQLKIRGKFHAATQVISVEEGLVSANPIERSVGQAGDGGTIKVGAFRVALSENKEVKIPLELENAHFHWLGRPIVEDLFPLDFRVSGLITASFRTPPENGPWELSSQLDLSIPSFVLDNARLKRKGPWNKIVAAEKIQLKGNVLVNSEGLEVGELKLTQGISNEFKVSGRVDFNKGPDLKIVGDVDTAQVGQIAEVDIVGKGELTTLVRGPNDHILVDFHFDLKDTKYLSLNLGNLKGKITLDDGESKLYFRDISARLNHTHYVGNGSILLDSKKEHIKMDFDFKDGDISDVSHIFLSLTDHLWWFPHTLSGSAKGKIEVSGPLDLDDLKVLGRFRGKDWNFYGERFNEVSISGGYDGGVYFVERARASKYRGKIDASISFDEETSKIKWKFDSQSMTLTDLDRLARINVPLRGDVELKSQGEGRLGSIDSQSNLRVDNIALRGRAIPPSSLEIVSTGRTAIVRGHLSGNQGRLELSYDFGKKARSFIRGGFDHFDFSPIILMLNPSLLNDGELKGKISGRLNIDFESGKVELGSGFFELTEYELAKTGTQFQLASPVLTEVDQGSFQLKNLIVRGDKGEGRISVNSKRSVLSGGIIGRVDLSIVEFLTPVVESASGLAQLNLRIEGTLKEPDVSGRAVIRSGSVRVSGLDAPFENIKGLFTLKQNVLKVRDVESDLATGRANFFGEIELFAHRYPTLNVTGLFSNSRIQLFPFQSLKVRGKLHAYGETIPYRVDGDFIVNSGLITEPILSQKKSQSRQTLKYVPPPSSTSGGDFPVFELNIRARAERGVYVKNDLFDAELKGDVVVINTIALPRLQGTAEVLSGKMQFKDREFEVQEGKVEFDKPSVIDPKFSLLSRTTVNNTKIRLFASGRLSDWGVEFSSDPVLPENEILSLLAVGFTSEDMQKLRAGDQSVLQQGEAASLLLHSFDFNRDIKKRTGLEIQLDESFDTQSGLSKFRPQTASEAEATSAAPKIVIKRRIGKRVDVSVGSTVGVGTQTEREAKAEVHMTKGMSVIGVVNTFEGVNTTEPETSLGVDLKFKKRFK